MPSDLPSMLKQFSSFFGKGFVAEMGPEIAKGAIVELFRTKRLDLKEVTRYVENNISLWDNLDSEYQGQLKRLAQKLGNLDFITTEWAIDSLRSDFPALASLFLGWRKAHNWLERQLDELKRQVQ